MCYTATQVTKAYEFQDFYKASLPKPESLEKLQPLFKASGFVHPYLAVIFQKNNKRQLEAMKWGLMPTWKKPLTDMVKLAKSTLNAKAETLRTLPSFRASVKDKRCIIPVNSFFEYKHVDGDKLPYLIHPKEQPFFNLAGLYSHYKNPDNNEWLTTFTIVTEPANVFMSDIHNSAKRMPLMLSNELIADWINPDSPSSMVDEILKYACDDSSLLAYRVRRDLIKAPNDESVLTPINF